jgi:hypothetical protein
MKTVRLLMLVAIVGFCLTNALARNELPAAAREVIKQFEDEAAELDRKTETEIVKLRERGVTELKKAQDELTRQGKLDEASAVRDLIQRVSEGVPVALGPTIPSPLRKAYRQFEEEMATVYEKAEADFATRREKTAVELKKLQEAFCKEAKLDDALAVRDLVRGLRDGKINALPDPGYVNVQMTDVGKTFYYEVTGVGQPAGYVIYGNDVYVVGSHLGMATVHCGLLKEGQKGVVKVTILGGQDSFPSTTRNGITSQPYGRAEFSFKVDRVYSFQSRAWLQPPPVAPAVFRKGEFKDKGDFKDKAP